MYIGKFSKSGAVAPAPCSGPTTYRKRERRVGYKEKFQSKCFFHFIYTAQANASFLFYCQKPLQVSGSGVNHNILSEYNSMLDQSHNTQFPELKICKDTSKKVEEEKEPKMIFLICNGRMYSLGFM